MNEASVLELSDGELLAGLYVPAASQPDRTSGFDLSLLSAGWGLLCDRGLASGTVEAPLVTPLLSAAVEHVFTDNVTLVVTVSGAERHLQLLVHFTEDSAAIHELHSGAHRIAFFDHEGVVAVVAQILARPSKEACAVHVAARTRLPSGTSLQRHMVLAPGARGDGTIAARVDDDPPEFVDADGFAALITRLLAPEPAGP